MTLAEWARSPQSGNLIVKRRCVAAGVNPRDLSAGSPLGFISSRGGSPGRAPARGRAAVPAPLRPTGGQLYNGVARTKGKGAPAGDLNGRVLRSATIREGLKLAAANLATRAGQGIVVNTLSTLIFLQRGPNRAYFGHLRNLARSRDSSATAVRLEEQDGDDR